MLELLWLLLTTVLAWARPRQDLVLENLLRGELLKLGIAVSNRSIRRYRWRGPAHSPSQTWRTFLRNHAHHL